MAYGAESGVAEAPRTAGVERPERGRRWLPASALEFIGCETCRMTLAEYEALPDDAKVELFDAEMGRAWRVAEPAKAPHERPLAMFASFVNCVAMVRGAPILLGRSAGLDLLDADRAQVRAMHPDEMVFRTRRARRGSVGVRVQAEQEHPDVVWKC